MEKLLEPKESLLTIKYRPNDEILYENPPRFSWMPSSEKDLIYRLQVSTDPGFSKENTETITGIAYNFYTLDHILIPGTYYWRYGLGGAEDGQTSQTRAFTVAQGAARTPLTGRAERYQHVTMSHPRIWMNQDTVAAFKSHLKEDRTYCGFDEFYKNLISKYLKKGFITEPLPYPNHKRTVSLWRQNYTDCQEALSYIRSLCVGGTFLDDSEMIQKAKEALLELAGWDPDGSTSRDYNDECAFRVAYALAFGYDWLYDELTQEERRKVFEKLYIRTKQVADHVIIHSRIHFSLYDSHAVRSLSSVLTPCCIAMLGESEEARDWLDYTIEYFSVVYTPWGGTDGGWAEGSMYWTTGMAFVIDAFNTIKSFTGINLYQRPFFQTTGDFPLYCNPVDTYRATFCDQSNLGKYPGHKLAYNIRQFAGVTGNQNYQNYYEEVFKREPMIDQDFFNNGWWDFHFDDMVYRHDYGDVLLTPAEDSSLVKWFHDIGWVAINKNREDFDSHIFFLTKSSPYGSVSHSHGDQNSFFLFAYGEPLVIKSGYYIGFNTSMHRDWRRQTKSHNNILINGNGQYAGMDKAKQLSAKGSIEEVTEKENQVYIRENATKAYRENGVDIKDYTREIYFVDETYFVIVDSVETESPSVLDWLLHSLTQFDLEQLGFSVIRKKAVLEGRFLSCSSGFDSMSQTDEFTGVDAEEIADLENQWHLTMKTKASRKHLIVTLLVPSKTDEKNIVTAIKDDQGHDIYFYFSHAGKTFSLKTDGSRRY